MSLIILNPDLIFKPKENKIQVINIENGQSFLISEDLYHFLRDFDDNQDLSVIPNEIREQLISNNIIIEKNHYHRFSFKPQIDSVSRIKLCSISVEPFFKKYNFLLNDLFFHSIIIIKFIIILAGVISLSLLVVDISGKAITTGLFSKISIRDLIILYLLTSMTIVLHEISHLYCYKYYGDYPAKIRVILFFFSLTLCCNLTGVYFLDKKKSFITLIAGSFSQLVINGICLIIIYLYYINTGHILTVLMFFVAMNSVSCILNFFPLIKYDGYWLLALKLQDYNLMQNSLDYLYKKFKKIPDLSNHQKTYLLFGISTIIAHFVAWLSSLIVIYNFLQNYIGTYSIFFVLIVASVILLSYIRKYTNLKKRIYKNGLIID